MGSMSVEEKVWSERQCRLREGRDEVERSLQRAQRHLLEIICVESAVSRLVEAKEMHEELERILARVRATQNAGPPSRADVARLSVEVTP